MSNIKLCYFTDNDYYDNIINNSKKTVTVHNASILLKEVHKFTFNENSINDCSMRNFSQCNHALTPTISLDETSI